MPDVSDRRPFVKPKVTLVATIEGEIADSELKRLRDSVNTRMNHDFIKDVGADPTVDSIGVELISSLKLSDINELSEELESSVEAGGHIVDGEVQVMSIADRVSVR